MKIDDATMQYGLNILRNTEKEFREWIEIRDSIIIDLLKRSPEILEEFITATADISLVDADLLRQYRDGKIKSICVWLEGAHGIIIKKVNFPKT